MSDDWIIAVLTDLQDYSVNNNLADLAASLQDSKRVARAELAQESADVFVGNMSGTKKRPNC
jgi:hypothetical protein